MSTLITYEENGFPVELTTEAEMVRAIRQNRVRTETIVQEHRPDGTIATLRAGDVPALRALLSGGSEPPAVPASPLPEPAPPAPASAPITSETDRVPPRTAPRIDARSTDPEPAWEAAGIDDPVVEQKSGAGALWWVLGLVLLAVGVTAWIAAAPPQVEEVAAPAPVASEARPLPTDTIGSETEYWASRKVTVRTIPRITGAALGDLGRDDAIRGVIVRGPSGANDWVRIAIGRYAGGYVWLGDLADVARPVLAVVLDDAERQIAVARPAYAAPDFSSNVRETFVVGATVRVAGRTAEGWWEITLGSGGVGYLPADAIVDSCTGADCRIITADGWGDMRTGMSVGDVEAASGVTLNASGKYDDVGETDENGVVTCNVHGLTNGPGSVEVMVEQGTVTSITVSGDGFRTDRGIGIGDTEDAVRQAYPTLDETAAPYSDAPDKNLFFRDPGGNGIRFSISNGVVSSMTVGGKSIEYVEGCL